MRSGTDARGHTLIETLLVVIILGLTAVATVSWLGSSLDDGAIRAATDEIVTALEYGRLFAVNSGLPSRVIFDEAKMTAAVERYTTAWEEDLRDTSVVAIGSTKADDWAFATARHPVARGKEYIVDLSRNSARGGGGVDDLKADFAGANSVEFDETGAASAPGIVTIKREGRQVDITVDSLTGRVSVDE